MQSFGSWGNLQLRCLLLLCIVTTPGWATVEEGTILLTWKGKLGNGDKLANWAGSTDPCSKNSTWSHVLCDSAGYVQQIDLGISNLSGPLVPELGQLSKLQFLSVNNNSFNGGIPQELGNLTALNLLDLSANQLSGPIPSSFSKLTSLKNLTLSSNKFSGSFPVSLIQLHKLSELNLDSNFIAGVLNITRILNIIDATATIYEVQSLTVVRLMNNNISDAVYKPDDLLNNRTFFKLQGNPYCAYPIDSYDDGRRCFCQQNCSITRATSGLEEGTYSSWSYLDLSDNQLSGPVPDSFEKLTSLTFLNLSFNSFTGSFPEFLLKRKLVIELGSNSITGVINLTHIREANLEFSTVGVENNSITDVVYRPADLLQNGIFRLQGNPYCAGSNKSYDDGRRCFCQGVCASSGKYTKRLATIIGIVSGAVSLVLAIICGVMFKVHAKRKLRKLEVEYRHKFAEFEVNPQPFLYNELRLATQDFNESTKLGQGSFGTVYKGILLNGNEVAIKKLKPMTVAPGVEVDDFLNEVVFITKMKHRNLVDLKGYCMRGKERMLVYEFVENMDVEQSLLLGKNKEAVNWPVRFNICLGVAQGLHYLHTYAQPRVIHRDIKASNILLDTNYTPKIADFGLALLFPDEKTHISTATVAGTRGYLAPEYASYGELSEKADIYSFGVLCLEIVSGRKNIDQAKPANQVYLPSWVWKLHEERKLKDLIDPSLHLQVDEVKQALRVINTALCCLQQIPDRRPSMSNVQTILQGEMEPDEIVFSMKQMVDFSTFEDSIIFDDTAALVSGASTKSLPSRGS